MCIVVPDVFHTVSHSMLKHLTDWAMSFLEQHSTIDKFNQHCVMIPLYPDVSWYIMPYSQVMQWNGQEMKALGCVMVPVFEDTHSNTLVSQRIPFTKALFCVNNLAYSHLMTQDQYHTKATIEYMEKYLEEFHCHIDVFSWFHTCQLTKTILQAFKKQLTLDTLEDQVSDLASNNLLVAGKCPYVDDDETQIWSEIEKHHVNVSHFNCLRMHLLNHFIEHIRQLGNLLNASSELPEWAIMDSKLVYRPSNDHQPAIQILSIKAWMKVFQSQ